MSAYNFINEYFPGWDVLGDVIIENNQMRHSYSDVRKALRLHL